VAVPGWWSGRDRHQGIQEAQGGRGGLVAPEHQGPVEAGGERDPVLQRAGDGYQEGTLGKKVTQADLFDYSFSQ